MKNILAKLALIRNDIDPMRKDGRNEKQNYNFLSDKQITLEISRLFEKHNIIVTHSDHVISETQYQTANGSTMFLTTVGVDYCFFDVDSSERIEGSVVGQGSDTGDKGIYKAITGAFKYLYVKTFNIPVSDDPENENTHFEAKKLAEKVGGTVVSTGTTGWQQANIESKKCIECGNPTGNSYNKCKACYFKPKTEEITPDQIPF